MMNDLQLPLSLNIRDDATLANFFKGNNGNLMDAIKNLIALEGERLIYIWGQSGVGRSHLLQACCHSLNAENQRVAYLPLKENQQLTPEILEGLENFNLICLDDIDAVMGDKHWEERLFYFYNRVVTQNTRLLIAASQSPQTLNAILPDLKSRLAAMLVFQIQPLNEDQMILALQMRAYYRGLTLSREVVQYLIRRYPRNMGALFEVLIQLDRASLVAKRRLTIPFVKQVLGSEI